MQAGCIKRASGETGGLDRRANADMSLSRCCAGYRVSQKRLHACTIQARRRRGKCAAPTALVGGVDAGGARLQQAGYWPCGGLHVRAYTTSSTSRYCPYLAVHRVMAQAVGTRLFFFDTLLALGWLRAQAIMLHLLLIWWHIANMYPWRRGVTEEATMAKPK
ncbi:hypothetical protein GGI43DRAFT_335686 [Trichoderma evansii]